MLQETARYKLPHPGTVLVVSLGSVAELRGDAIVNAANRGCIGGGGVDGAISKAGGKNLFRDRCRLPVLRLDRQGREVRCEIGSAVSTGPNDYGSLPPLVIHAVGPNFNYFRNSEEAAMLLKSAYTRSLDIMYNFQNKYNNSPTMDGMKMQIVGFSLLSAGLFRGRLALSEVLFIAIEAIRDWCNKMYHRHIDQGTGLVELKEIHLCGFTEHECHVLNEVCLVLLEPKSI